MPALVPFFPFQLHKEDRELQSNRIIWWIRNVWTKLYFEGILLHNHYNCTENASIRIIQSLTFTSILFTDTMPSIIFSINAHSFAFIDDVYFTD